MAGSTPRDVAPKESGVQPVYDPSPSQAGGEHIVCGPHPLELTLAIKRLEQLVASNCALDNAATVEVGLALREAIRDAVVRGLLDYQVDNPPAPHAPVSAWLLDRAPNSRHRGWRLHVHAWHDPACVRVVLQIAPSESAFDGQDVPLLAATERPPCPRFDTGSRLKRLLATMDEVWWNEQGTELCFVRRARASRAC